MTRVVVVNSIEEAEIARIAASIDTHSDHPLAQAVVKYAGVRGIDFPRSENYQTRKVMSSAIITLSAITVSRTN